MHGVGMLDAAFLDWLRTTTEDLWSDPDRFPPAVGPGAPVWQPGTRWRGGMSASDLEIVEAMFSVRLPPDYRRFLRTLHTPDPPLAGMRISNFRVVSVEERLFPDWTGATTPLIAAFEAPLAGVLRGVALGRWHPAWGDRPDDPRQRERQVRALAAAAPRLIPFAGQRYLVASDGAEDGPVLAAHGAEVSFVAPDLRRGLLRELGLSEDSGAVPNRAPEPPTRVPFWSDVADGLAWFSPETAASA